MPEERVRQARVSDYEDVVSFTEQTWPELEFDDYLPDVFHEWVAGDGPGQRTLVAEVDGTVIGVCQCVVLGDQEAWAQGLRVDPAYRGGALSTRLIDACATWAGAAGATVMRSMVLGWNRAGIGASRAAQFEPVTQFRWVQPDPAPGHRLGDDHEVTTDPRAGWAFWQESDAESHLSGLGLDMDETWAISAVTRGRFERAADEETQITITRGDTVCATTYRVRCVEQSEGSKTVSSAEYGASAWSDLRGARALFGAIRDDAATLGADRTRVLVPETARFVSDSIVAASDVSDQPDLVFERDLSGISTHR